MNTKDHDGIFKTAFKEPKRAASLLKLAAKKNKSLAKFLQVVDLKTMRAERSETNRQGLKGSGTRSKQNFTQSTRNISMTSAILSRSR